MTSSVTRRDFLKFASLLSLSHIAPLSLSNLNRSDDGAENVLIILFDAWAAANMSLYGYERKTTPKLERLAEKAIVYHNHYAGSYYTTPGTASLLTGVTPWTHHAFNYDDTVEDHLIQKTIFEAFSSHHRMAYTHNPLANTLLLQFMADIDELTPWERLYFENDAAFSAAFRNDFDIASISKNRALKQHEDGFSFSLFLAKLYETYKRKRSQTLKQIFPRGVPDHDGLEFFVLEDAIDWIAAMTESTHQPFLSYYHLFPPHDPYHTRVDFYDTFAHDGYQPISKPDHFFKGAYAKGNIIEERRWYDEFSLYVDAEFERLYRQLEESGILENTWLILTTDHGEIFERGIIGHTTPVFYQPLMHVPLVIFPPGQESRIDVHDNTSAIDLLPTLCQVADQEIPAWAEGVVMPPFSEPSSAHERDISTIQVEIIDKKGEILAATAMLLRERLKLMWSFGYEELGDEDEVIELYDLAADPEELHNLAPERKSLVDEFQGILQAKIEKLSQAYQ